jgi:carboxylesterase
MHTSPVIPGAEPFYFPGGTTGCLLIHGFTGTPKEMRGLGEYLSQQGYAVLDVRLAGHATCPEDMLHVRWEDWVASVEDGWNLLAGSTQQAFVAGLSMGGVLALHLAAHHPVAGVIAMSTPHHLPDDPRLRFIEILSKFQPRVSKGNPDWFDPAVLQEHIDYPYYPTRAIAELRDLLAEMRTALPRVTAPALLIHSKNDGSVRPEDGHVEQIYAALGSPAKRIQWIEGSGHVITCDAARCLVFECAADFIHQISQESVCIAT